MISTESRMLENSTSGLMSGGEETQLGTRLRHRRVAKAAGNSDSLDLRQARLPSTLQASDCTFIINRLQRQKRASGTTNGLKPVIKGSQTIILRTPPGAGSMPKAS